MKPRIVVTQGDLGGIAPEVLLVLLADPKSRAKCSIVVLGHIEYLRQVAIQNQLDIEFQSVATAAEGFALANDLEAPVAVCELKSPQPSTPVGVASSQFGAAAVEAVVTATKLCVSGEAEAMLTPPVNKLSMHLAGYNYEGQTQIIGETTGSLSYGMLACAGKLRAWIATRHMSLSDAIKTLSIDYVVEQIRIAHYAARETLGISNPQVALAGINPHASENGAFGNEEQEILLPAIEEAERRFGFSTSGPHAPDVVFSEGAQGKHDVVIALYHDQAFIALKMLPREQSMSLFVGADIVRTSPMHGSAYDIVGQKKADARPLRYCLQQAVRLVEKRRLLLSR